MSLSLGFRDCGLRDIDLCCVVWRLGCEVLGVMCGDWGVGVDALSVMYARFGVHGVECGCWSSGFVM